MKNKNSSNIIIITFFIGVIIVSSFIYFLNINRKVSFFEKNLKDISVNVYGVFAKGVTPSNELNIKNSLNRELENEVDSLKKVLELNHSLSGFEYVNATVLSRNVSYWLNNIVIDKGSNDSIKKNNAVITTDGLIGKVTMVEKNSSVVKLLTSATYKVSVSVGNKYGILEDYDSKDKYFKVTGIDRDVAVEIGDEVTTSGLGGVFPSGIKIGKVSKIKNDNYGTSKLVYVETEQDFNSIRYVVVLENYNE